MPETPDDARFWRIIEISEPLDGLLELYEHDRALYVDAIAERLLGPAGRMIAASKTRYWERHRTNLPVFNANVCTRERGKIWFGDLDLTLEEPQLRALARAINERIFVLHERAARFGNEGSPAFDEAVAVIAPDGAVELGRWTMRAADGRLRPKERDA